MATRSFKLWSIAIALAGVLAGGAAGLGAQSESEELETGIGGGAGGCTCTISGAGSHTCSTTHACTAGGFKCTVNCN